MRKTRPAIIIMAKAPRLGRAKTRLRGLLTDEEAETLAGAFCADTLRYVRTTGIEIIIAFTPTGGLDELKELTDAPDTVVWTEQARGDLGERLVSAVGFARSRGFWPVVFLGTDSPNLPAGMIQSALTELENGGADIVLGPCTDGGYYLIGFGRFERELFDGVPWSTAKVFERTLANAERLRYTVAVLGEWYDVDEPGDLRRLSVDVLAEPSSAPATCEWLKRHGDTTFSGADGTSDREFPG